MFWSTQKVEVLAIFPRPPPLTYRENVFYMQPPIKLYFQGYRGAARLEPRSGVILHVKSYTVILHQDGKPNCN